MGISIRDSDLFLGVKWIAVVPGGWARVVV